MPPLADLLGPTREREAPMSGEQRLERMEAIARSWASLTAVPDPGGADG